MPKRPVHFEPCGPFPLTRTTNRFGKSISDLSVKNFWESSSTASLKDEIGCYLFVLGRKPFYVGKATKSFGQEVFNPKNMSTYRDLVTRFPGKPSLYFVAHRKGAERRGASPRAVISHVEKLLIGLAHEANAELTNVQHRNKPERFCIAGVYNSGKGKPSKSATMVRDVLRLQKKK